MVTASFQDIIETYQVALDIDIRIGDAISDASLSSQVDYNLWLVFGKDIEDKWLVGNISFDELERRVSQQLLETLLLQADIVVVVHVVNTDNNVCC